MSSDPPSPCTGICEIDWAVGWCSGSRRTLDEIAAWPSLSPSMKRDVLAGLAERACAEARGGE